MKRLFLLLVCFFVQSLTIADETTSIPPHILKLIEQLKSERAAKIAESQKELSAIESTLKRRDPNRTKEEAKQLANHVKSLKADIAARKSDNKFSAPRLDLFQPRKGTIGKIPDLVTITVLQIIDANTMHVIPSETRTKIDFVGFEAKQSFYEEEGPRLIIRGISTTGTADKSKVRLRQLFEITGTESFTSVVGDKRTVFVLQPINIDKWVPEIEKALAEK